MNIKIKFIRLIGRIFGREKKEEMILPHEKVKTIGSKNEGFSDTTNLDIKRTIKKERKIERN